MHYIHKLLTWYIHSYKVFIHLLTHAAAHPLGNFRYMPTFCFSETISVFLPIQYIALKAQLFLMLHIILFEKLIFLHFEFLRKLSLCIYLKEFVIAIFSLRNVENSFS